MPDWLAAPDYTTARWVVQHLVALVYVIAFTVALAQFRPLIGERGLTPIPRFLARTTFRRHPSLFHLRYSDTLFRVVAALGLALAVAALAGATDVLPLGAGIALWAVLWVLYLSIVNVGQVWYGFGWESLLLEAGFLVTFLGPADVAPPAPILWLLVWLLFRVEFGAGLIKLRGDRCWRDLTCLEYHHETQPLPGPTSRFFHHLPRPLHRAEVLANHVTQLVVPFLLFLPQPVASIAAVVVIVTQGWLVSSGNFAWLNLLTITLAFAAIDDARLGWLLSLSTPRARADVVRRPGDRRDGPDARALGVAGAEHGQRPPADERRHHPGAPGQQLRRLRVGDPRARGGGAGGNARPFG